MSEAYRYLNSHTNRRVFDTIRENPGITVRDICDRLPELDDNDVRSAVQTLNGRLIRPRKGSASGTVRRWEVIR